MQIWIPVIVSVISAVGSILGVYFSNRKAAIDSAALLDYRIGQLEAKVDRHNNVIERTYMLEGRMNEVEHEIRDIKGGK